MTNKPESAAVEAVAWRYWNETPASHINVLGPGQYEYMDAGKWYPDHAEPLYPQSALDALRGEVERFRKSNELYSFAMNTAGIDELKRRADAAERRVAELEAGLASARRSIGDHHAPNDCYATGPLTGDEFLDLVQCPACAFLDQYATLTKESQ